jgi:predicted transcriptional regulator
LSVVGPPDPIVWLSSPSALDPKYRTFAIIWNKVKIKDEYGNNLPPGGIFRTFIEMEIHLTPEQETRLAQIAAKAGTAPERVVANVVTRYLGEEARFLASVEKGIAAAERGEFIEEAEMDARLEAMFKP